MFLHRLLIVKYNTDKTATNRQLLQDVEVDISPAGLLVQEVSGITYFVPSHMLVSAKFVDRKHFKSAEVDDDFKRQAP